MRRRRVVAAVAVAVSVAVCGTGCGATDSATRDSAVSPASTSVYPVPIPPDLRRYYEPARGAALCLPEPVWDGSSNRSRAVIEACQLGWQLRADVSRMPTVAPSTSQAGGR